MAQSYALSTLMKEVLCCGLKSHIIIADQRALKSYVMIIVFTNVKGGGCAQEYKVTKHFIFVY